VPCPVAKQILSFFGFEVDFREFMVFLPLGSEQKSPFKIMVWLKLRPLAAIQRCKRAVETWDSDRGNTFGELFTEGIIAPQEPSAAAFFMLTILPITTVKLEGNSS
jgi:hypothetical protein